ncbi:MAG: DNA repair exonuclease [Phycisphaerales bacterium]
MAEARFLAAADLHLGRPIASLPEALRDRSRELGPFGALEQLIELARDENVDAVLLAGDVVDDDGAYFEVFAALQGAISKLDGIPLLAITGNHDARVLPKLAEAIDGLTLLGLGGVWQSRIINTALGGVEVLGWGFPSTHCTTSPFEAPPPSRSGPRVGLLHGDLDATRSVYAPFTSADLREHAADAWLLGHVHNPSHERLCNASPAGYLGSVCGLDPGEPGPRGAWLVRMDGSGTRLDHRPLGPIAWATIEVDCHDIRPEALDGVLRERAEHVADGLESARAVGVRVSLAGEHAAWQALNARAAGIETGHPWQHRDKAVFIERLDARVTPPLPLERLASERSAAGRIAGLILELRAGKATEVVEEASDRFAAIATNRNLRPPDLGEHEFPLPDPRETLEREARLVLSEMLAQRESEDG